MFSKKMVRIICLVIAVAMIVPTGIMTIMSLMGMI